MLDIDAIERRIFLRSAVALDDAEALIEEVRRVRGIIIRMRATGHELPASLADESMEWPENWSDADAER